jgi:subtilisin family serine protease
LSDSLPYYAVLRPHPQQEGVRDRSMADFQLSMTLSFRACLPLLLTLGIFTCSHSNWAALTNPSASVTSDEPSVTVYLVLEGDSTVQAALKSAPAQPQLRSTGSAKSVADLSRSQTLRAVVTAKNRAFEIERQHLTVKRHLDTMNGRVLARYQRLANALKVRLPASKLEALRGIPGVVRIESPRLYQRAVETSVPFVGAPSVWKARQFPADGAGIRIGFIDTGIDYTHADFGGSGDPADYAANDPTIIEAGTFPTAKVVGGYDFAGNTYNPASSDPVLATALPDPDPLDCNGHGSHVAGIAGGFGVLTNNLTFAGPYDQNLNAGMFRIGPGVAPKAKLYALKIFGCDGPTDLILDALEWAADPDGDLDFSDRLDIVNMSLGSSFGIVSPDDVVLNAANRLAELGCVVVVAAGNSGNIFYTTSAPGVAERALSVANSIDNGSATIAVEVTAPSSIAGKYEAIEGDFTRPLIQSGPISGSVVYAMPTKGCEDLTNAPAVLGNIALMDRGVCFFAEKIKRAQEAGAVAVIMINNIDGPPIVMGSTNTDITIPAVMISRTDGELFKRNLAALRVRLDASLIFPGSDRSDQLDESSSRGPSSPGSLLKPEIAAPGSAISSVQSGSGTNSAIISGTSMAAPHVAGAAALLKQLHPDWTVEEIKAALMNSAVPMLHENGRTYPESRVGAGRLDIARGAQLPVTAAAENAAGLVSLSFGDLTLTNSITLLRHIRLTNHSTNSVTYDVTVAETVSESGFDLAPVTNSVLVPPRGSVSCGFVISADPKLFDRTGDDTTPTRLNGEPRHSLYEASGQIMFHNADHSLHVPYYGILRAASDFHATVTNVTVASGNRVDVSIPLQGSSAHRSPLVSVFQLGARSSNQKHSDAIFISADLLAVGAATDAAALRSVDNSSTYFGIATAGPWTTPQSFLVQFQVLIDSDRDGIVDYELVNANDGAVAAQNLFDPEVANDVFLTAVRNIATSQIDPGGYLNVFAANQSDTAPFNNSVLVLSVPSSAIGLGDQNSKFNYKVLSRAPLIDGGTLQIDQTPWIQFDAGRPPIDAALFGIELYPFYEDGKTVRVRVDRPAALAAGFTANNPLQLLLLHHLNTSGRRIDIVQLDLGPEDTDNDGLPDSWERQNFGNLSTATANTDFDRDGLSDANEFHAGTDPNNHESLLKIMAVTTDAGTGVKLQWSSVSGKTYAVQRTTRIEAGFVEFIAQDIPATLPTNIFQDTTATGGGPYYYRIVLLE